MVVSPAAITKVTNFEANVFTDKWAAFVHFLVLFIGFFLDGAFVISSLLFERQVSLDFILEVSF